jgi:hypothetical protein
VATSEDRKNNPIVSPNHGSVGPTSAKIRKGSKPERSPPSRR